jgi:hypothetical protein
MVLGVVYFWEFTKSRFTVTNFVVLEVVGSAIAQAVSVWISTAAARVRVRVWSCGVCGGQSGPGAGFLRGLQFPLTIFIPAIAPQSPSSGIGTITGQQWPQYQLDSVSSHQE